MLRLAAAAGIAVAEGDYTLPQLYNAAEAFVTGTMGGLAPVVSVDGRAIGDGAIGPVTKQLTEPTRTSPPPRAPRSRDPRHSICSCFLLL